ncbi:MAG TPA: site-specific integrase [Acidimicrobiales bacterium]|nr:site-specific integrase [Acidimicrobiales bacterium]
MSSLAIQQWLAGELERRSRAAVAKSYRMLRMILRTAIRMDVLVKDPCVNVKVPRPVRHEMRFLDAGQVEDLADAVHPAYRALVYVLGYAGLRWGEAAGLRRRNVDLLARQVVVVEQLVELPGGGHRHGPPKSKAGVRRVSLPSFVCDVLGAQMAERSQPGAEGLVFVNTHGGALRRSTFRRNAWLPATGRLGMAGLRPHDLRHTAVALAIAEGAHPVAIQKRLGHADIATTLGVYGHLFPSLDEHIAQGMDETRARVVAERRTRQVVSLPEKRAAACPERVLRVSGPAASEPPPAPSAATVQVTAGGRGGT